MGGWWFKRSRILELFDKKLADTGCTHENMFALERWLEVKLFAVDALGNTGTAANITPAQRLLCHATTTTPGQISWPILQRSYKFTCWMVSPKRPCLQHQRKWVDRKTWEFLVAFAAKAIQLTVQVWPCGQAYVGSDGSLWRSRNVGSVIDMAFAEETGLNPWDDLPEELAIEYHQVTYSMGSATAYCFRK